MLQAMNTGHDGSMSTGHGNSVSGMLRRLEAMYLMSAQIPMDAIRAQIVEGIDVMIHLGRLAGRAAGGCWKSRSWWTLRTENTF